MLQIIYLTQTQLEFYLENKNLNKTLLNKQSKKNG